MLTGIYMCCCVVKMQNRTVKGKQHHTKICIVAREFHMESEEGEVCVKEKGALVRLRWIFRSFDFSF